MIVEKKIKTKEVVITKEVDVPTYTINLSEYDAALLWVILGYCTASPLSKVFYKLNEDFGDKVDLNECYPTYINTIYTNPLLDCLDELSLSKGV